MSRTLPRPTVARGRTMAISGLLLTATLASCSVSGPPNATPSPSTSTTDNADTQQGTSGTDPIPAADKDAWMKTVTSMQKTDDDTLYHTIAALWNGTANAPFEETKKLDVPVAKYAITLICAGKGSAVATVRFGNQEVVTPILDCTPSHAKQTTTISTTKDAEQLTVKMRPEVTNTVIAGVDVVRAGSATSADDVDKTPIPTSTSTTSKQPSKEPTTSKPAPKPSTFTTRPRPTFSSWRPTYPPGYPTPTRYPSTWPPSDDEG